MTVIEKAKELIKEQGTTKALEYFQDKINELGEPKSFPDICKLSGFETAIMYIKDTEALKK